MPCFHPLHGFDIGRKTANGKPHYFITSGDVNEIRYQERTYTDPIDIPCGKCYGCRLEYARQWAIRCMLEAKSHEKNCFLTLTYDNEHLPDPLFLADDESGEIVKESDIHSLRKSDLQLFIKRLRQRLVDEYERRTGYGPSDSCYDPPRIRYFACGEYGSAEKTMRPHYHLIIFGEDFSFDRTYLKSNFQGDKYYTSAFLDDIWKFGYHLLGDLSFDSAAYVARYVLKKQKGMSRVVYDELLYEPEFVVMSRRPGIGRAYFDENFRSIYKNQEIFLKNKDRTLKLRPPRYYDNLFLERDPDTFELIKARRKHFAEQSNIIADSKTSLNRMDRLSVAEHDIKQRTKIFKERSVEK